MIIEEESYEEDDDVVIKEKEVEKNELNEEEDNYYDEEKDENVIKPKEEKPKVINDDEVEDSLASNTSSYSRRRRVKKQIPEIETHENETENSMDISLSESTPSTINTQTRLNKSYETFTNAPKSKKNDPEFWTEDNFFSESQGAVPEKKNEKPKVENKEPIYVAEIIKRPQVKGNRKLPSRVKSSSKPKEAKNEQKPKEEEKKEVPEYQQSTQELLLPKHFAPSAFVAKPSEETFPKVIESKKSSTFILTSGENNDVAQPPGDGPLRIIIMKDAANIPLRANASEYSLDQLHKTIFSSKTLPFTFDSPAGKHIIETVSKLKGDKIVGLFNFCKELIDFGFYPISDDVICNAPIFTTNTFVKGARITLELCADGKINAGKRAVVLDGSSEAHRDKYDVVVGDNHFTVESYEKADELCKEINDFINGKCLSLLNFFIKKLSHDESLPPEEQIIDAISSSFMGFGIAMLTIPACSQRIAFLVFEALCQTNAIDGYIRAFLSEEITRSQVNAMFTNLDYFNGSLIALFVGVSEDWIAKMSASISEKSLDETIELLINAVVNAPLRSFYMMRTILILSIVSMSNKHSQLIPFVSFLRCAATPFGGYKALHELEVALIKNQKIDRLDLIPSFIKYVVKTVPDLSSSLSKEMCNELLAFARNNVESILRKINKRRAYHPSKHPLAFQVFQNAVFLTRDIISK